MLISLGSNLYGLGFSIYASPHNRIDQHITFQKKHEC